MGTWCVDVTKRDGTYLSVPFSCLYDARDFFELHKRDVIDLVELRQWNPTQRVWLIIDQFVQFDLIGVRRHGT